MRQLNLIFFILLFLSGCASTLKTTSQPVGLLKDKLTTLNVIYIDDLHNARSISSGNGTIAFRFVVETRESFAIGVLNNIPSEFKLHDIEANIDIYKLKNKKEISAEEIAKLFPNNISAPILVIMLNRIETDCANECFYDLSVTSKLIDVSTRKLYWYSTTLIETKLLDRVKFISTTENAKKYVKTMVEKMKADGLF